MKLLLEMKQFIYLPSKVQCLQLESGLPDTVGGHGFTYGSLYRQDGTKPGNLTVMTRLKEGAHSHCARLIL